MVLLLVPVHANGTDRPVCDPLSKNAWNSGHGIRTMRRELRGQHGVELRGLRAVGGGERAGWTRTSVEVEGRAWVAGK